MAATPRPPTPVASAAAAPPKPAVKASAPKASAARAPARKEQARLKLDPIDLEAPDEQLMQVLADMKPREGTGDHHYGEDRGLRLKAGQN